MKRAMKSEPMPDRYVEPHLRKKGPFQDHELQSGLRTLTEAHKIKKNPAFHGAIKAHAKSMMSALGSAREERAEGEKGRASRKEEAAEGED